MTRSTRYTNDPIDDLFDYVFSNFKFLPYGFSNKDDYVSYGNSIEVIEDKNKYVLTWEIAGFDKEDFDMFATNKMVSITIDTMKKEGARKKVQTEKIRQFKTDINPELIKAEYKNGVLTLEIPKDEKVISKKISL